LRTKRVSARKAACVIAVSERAASAGTGRPALTFAYIFAAREVETDNAAPPEAHTEAMQSDAASTIPPTDHVAC
jgi:hypothetical protein